MSNLRKNIYVVINPVSGTKSKKDIPLYFSKLDTTKYNVELFTTERPGHATEIATEAVNKKIDYVIAVGGDGTINEIAKALIGSETTLGIIPVGSGNGLARSLHIPMNKEKSLDIIKEGYIRRIDYGVANDHIFLCTCGVGFDAQVSEKALNQKNRGKLMYTKNMIGTFQEFKPEKYKIITPTYTFEEEAFVITCANATQYGNNAYIAPRASMEDGLMNVAILKPLSAMDVPKIAIQMFSQNIGNSRKLIEIITPEVTIVREKEGVMHMDGNAMYTGKEINIKIVNHGLNVLVPSSIDKKFDMQSLISNATKWI